MTIARRPLGRSGLTINGPFVLGGNVFGWTADEKKSFEVLDAFVAAGLNFIYSADAYSLWVPGHQGGESETMIGKWLKARGNRDKVMIATKFGLEVVPGESGLSRHYMQRAVERSLKRLNTDYIDLYQSHRDDPKAPFEETLAAYEELMKAGKVRAIGASNLDAAQLAEALRVADARNLPRYATLQPEYNLYDRDKYDGPLRDLAMREGLGVITYYGLASGFLSGKYRTPDDLKKSARGAGIGKRYMNPRGMRILAALDTVAARHDAQPAEVALAWLIQRPGVTAPIASATSLDQLASLMRATELQLSAEDVSTLEAASG